MKNYRVVACIAGKDPVRQARKAKKLGADLVEIRADLLEDTKNLATVMRTIKRSVKIGIILTVRSDRESGNPVSSGLSNRQRLRIYRSGLPYAEYVDLELSSRSILGKLPGIKRKLILSYHNFKRMPADLFRIIGRMKRIKPALIKIAVQPRGRADLIPLVSLLAKEKNIVVIALGKQYANTRRLFPLLGSRLTYCALNRATATGQISVADLVGKFTL